MAPLQRLLPVALATGVGWTNPGTAEVGRVGQAPAPVNILAFNLERQASGALAVLGLAAVPSETASALVLNTGSRPEGGNDFRAGQFGGGFTVSQGFPLYLEGYLGYNRYSPVYILSDGSDTGRLVPKWTGFAATGGIGWDFHLNDHLVLRPMLNVSLGQVVTDTAFVAAWIARQLDADDVHFLRHGGLTAGGIGGSMVLAYNQAWANDLEADVTLRYTNLILEPIAGDRDVTGSARAETLALWSRLRIPTGRDAFGGPLRTVAEFSASWLPGDQGEILNTDWLAQVGYGLEIDVAETPIPWVTKGRLMMRYTKGEHLEGYGLGVAVSF